MGRRKIHRRYRQKYSLHFNFQETSSSDKITLIPESPNMETPNFSDNTASNINVNVNISEDRTPEFVKEENLQLQYYDDMSPKINGRLPKPKLNLDLPENDDTEDVEENKDDTIKEQDNLKPVKDFDKTLSVDKLLESDCEENNESTIKACEFSKSYSMNFKTSSELVDLPRKELTSLSGYFQIPSSTFNINQAFVENGASNFAFITGQTKSDLVPDNVKETSPKSCENKTKRDNPKIIFSEENGDCFITDEEQNEKLQAENCCIAIELDEKIEDVSNTTKGIFTNDKEKSMWNISPQNITPVELPAVSDIEIKTTVVSLIISKNLFTC